jgi:hypothetical protein
MYIHHDNQTTYNLRDVFVTQILKILIKRVSEIRLTNCITTCKSCLSDQDISSEKSEVLDSPPVLEHAKVV